MASGITTSSPDRMESHPRRHESTGSASPFVGHREVKVQREKQTRQEAAPVASPYVGHQEVKLQREKQTRKQTDEVEVPHAAAIDSNDVRTKQIAWQELAQLMSQAPNLPLHSEESHDHMQAMKEGLVECIKDKAFLIPDDAEMRSPRTSDETIPEAQAARMQRSCEPLHEEIRAREEAVACREAAILVEKEAIAQRERACLAREEELWPLMKQQGQMQVALQSEKEEQKAEHKKRQQELELRRQALDEESKEHQKQFAQLEEQRITLGDWEEKMKAKQKELDEKENYLREVESHHRALHAVRKSPRGGKENLSAAVQRDLEEQRDRAMMIKRGSPDERARRDSIASSEASSAPRAS